MRIGFARKFAIVMIISVAPVSYSSAQSPSPTAAKAATTTPAPVRTCPCDGKRDAGDGLPTTASAITYSKVSSGRMAFTSTAMRQAAEALTRGPSFREFCSSVASSNSPTLTTAGFPTQQCATVMASSTKYKVELLMRCAGTPDVGAWLVREKDSIEELTAYLCNQVPHIISCDLYMGANNPNACCLDALRINGEDVPLDPKIGLPSLDSKYSCYGYCPRVADAPELTKKCTGRDGSYSCCKVSEGCNGAYCIYVPPTPTPSGTINH